MSFWHRFDFQIDLQLNIEEDKAVYEESILVEILGDYTNFIDKETGKYIFLKPQKLLHSDYVFSLRKLLSDLMQLFLTIAIGEWINESLILEHFSKYFWSLFVFSSCIYWFTSLGKLFQSEIEHMLRTNKKD